ncbi:hypothetical protein B0186_05335 [Canicola haemoglobinophilus]|uniref:Uncharacterized protein n=1 Tax=Canicola haemoglobinophilus TaxID=733 RepID=A0A1V4B1I9_9PAST|nr:hypothetical protein [Canicola haemoglobinophilus]OOS00995.1 hypothetical protein B0186_05335 [Canicola haemoglobinophilus]STO54903.1 Uncharacterised protein [Canicola haemoglobinophilus]STO59173.1 Uncharacterised protein [Canicola haemoglobinophilus]STO69526.1 Uncharacterised protein [Canicola haemoglobinophilus]
MFNQLHSAFIQHLHNQGEEFSNDKEQLDELYSLYDESALSTLNALRDFAELLYWHGINEDIENEEYQHITPSTLISIGILLRNNLEMLDLSLYAKDKIGDCLYSLANKGGAE